MPKKQIRGSLSWRKITISLALILVVALFLSHEYILKQIGHFLVFEQEPQKADVIVVLNGRATERNLAAADLFNAGYANLIILAKTPKQPGSDEFWKRVGKDFSNAKSFSERAFEALGISPSSLELIGQGVNSTYDEAMLVKSFFEKNALQSLILVTSKWHSRRAYWTFGSIFKDDDATQIIVHTSRYDTFDAESWWKNENDAELVIGEYVRLLYYLVTSRISLLT